MKRPVKIKDGKILQFSVKSQIFGKIAIIQQTRKLDLKQNFAAHLGQFHSLWEQAQENWSKQANQPSCTNLKKPQLV